LVIEQNLKINFFDIFDVDIRQVTLQIMTNESFKDGIETIMKPFFANAVEVLVVIIPFFPRGFAQKKKLFGIGFFFFCWN